MEMHRLESELQKAVSKSVRLLAEGHERFRVFTPFMFDDGDCFCIVIKKKKDAWYFTDEGHTFMHLSYEMKTASLNRGPRAKIIENVLYNFGITQEDGALICGFSAENLGGVFFAYVQALCKISDINFLTRERVASTFIDDCKQFFIKFVPAERITLDYCNKEWDSDARYPVDFCINGMARPVYGFAINNDSKCGEATIKILNFQKHEKLFLSLGVFEDQEKIGRRPLAYFSDVVDKQFSSLPANQDKIKSYIQKML